MTLGKSRLQFYTKLWTITPQQDYHGNILTSRAPPKIFALLFCIEIQKNILKAPCSSCLETAHNQDPSPPALNTFTKKESSLHRNVPTTEDWTAGDLSSEISALKGAQSYFTPTEPVCTTEPSSQGTGTPTQTHDALGTWAGDLTLMQVHSLKWGQGCLLHGVGNRLIPLAHASA